MLKQKLLPLVQKIPTPPKRILIGGGGLVCLLIVASWLFWPRTIVFSYAGQSCMFDAQLAPGLMKQQDQSKVKLTRSGGLSIGSTQLFSLQTCAEATAAPTKGDVRTAANLFGLPFVAAAYTVSIPDAPAVEAPVEQKLAVTKSLQASLDTDDQTFTYKLLVDDKSAVCNVSSQTISCPLKPLKLEQGKSYEYKIARTFADKSTGAVAAKTLETLPAVAVTESSISPGQTVYSKPKTVTLRTSKPLTSADVTLQKAGEHPEAISAATTVNNSEITITLQDDLPREAAYELVVKHAVAQDGSDLVEPHHIAFKTSGGPQITGVSVGDNNVQPGQAITVTFDQPLKAGQDIAKFISVDGVPASISYDKTAATVTLTGGTRCAAFKITVKKGLIGAENDLPGTKDWSHASHIACSESRVIGYSHEGRAITAYYYGSGSSTVLFTGGIHGEERSGSATMNSWTTYLEANAHKLPANRQVVVVPSINPDGLARGTRLNAKGVNLDRNYPASDWAKSIQTSGGHLPEGGGASAGSEPETRAMTGLINSLSLRLAVSHHAQGSLVGSNSVADADSLARTYASTVGYSSMIGSAEETMGYTITGEFETWLGERGTPAILIELPNRSSNFFGRHQSVLWRMATI